MFKQKPFPFSVVVLVILIALHITASYFSLYWRFPWFEIIVHILAGVWIGSIFLWLASFLNQINSLREYKTKSFLIALVSSALIGVIWELVENFSQLSFVNFSGYELNTAMDLLNDIIGGSLAYLYFIRRTKTVVKAEDTLHPFYNKLGVVNDKV